MTLVEWLAKHPDVVHTNTPLEVLASHMLHSLALFESTLLARADHDFFKPGHYDAPHSTSVDPPPAGPFAGGGDAINDRRFATACRSCSDD